jgi:hypothetical protein
LNAKSTSGDPLEKQKENYSGKKKMHTRKNIIISDKKKRTRICEPNYGWKKARSSNPRAVPATAEAGYATPRRYRSVFRLASGQEIGYPTGAKEMQG